MGEDGLIHARSRGDTSFLAKLHLKHIEQSGVDVPADVELASDRVSASSCKSTLAAVHIFEQASRRRQESLAAGIDEVTEELGTIQLSGDASRLVPQPNGPSSKGASEYDREEYPEPLLALEARPR